jgi:hypothetical protein
VWVFCHDPRFHSKTVLSDVTANWTCHLPLQNIFILYAACALCGSDFKSCSFFRFPAYFCLHSCGSSGIYLLYDVYSKSCHAMLMLIYYNANEILDHIYICMNVWTVIGVGMKYYFEYTFIINENNISNYEFSS